MVHRQDPELYGCMQEDSEDFSAISTDSTWAELVNKAQDGEAVTSHMSAWAELMSDSQGTSGNAKDRSESLHRESSMSCSTFSQTTSTSVSDWRVEQLETEPTTSPDGSQTVYPDSLISQKLVSCQIVATVHCSIINKQP